jgi:hypothetical protein
MTPDLTQVSEWAALAGPVAAISFVAGVAGATALSNAPYPRPGSSPDQITSYFSDNAGAARVSLVGQLVSAAALGVFTVSVIALGQRAGQHSRLIESVALAGGTISVTTLIASAVTGIQLTRGAANQSNSALALHHRAFVAGGPLHGPGIGLLMGALGWAGLESHSLALWLCMATFATAAAGLLAPLSLRVQPAVWLIPASRFPGLLLSAIAGAILSR